MPELKCKNSQYNQVAFNNFREYRDYNFEALNKPEESYVNWNE